MKKTLYIVSSIVFIIPISFSIVFAKEPSKREIIFHAIDADKDGKVTREEYINFQVDRARKRAEYIFDTSNKETDGTLSPSKFNELLNTLKEKLKGFKQEKDLD